MDGEQISWIDWINEIVAAAEQLKEAGMPLDLDPSEDLQVLHNMIAISAAEWRKGNQVDLDGPGMGKAIGDEKSYSPAQIYEQTWGKDTSDVDVTVVNNKFVPEFQNIDGPKLSELISTNPTLAAKAYLIVLQSANGYNNWSTWNSFVTNPRTPQFIDYAKQYTYEKIDDMNIPSDAVDPDRLYTPDRQPGTGLPLVDGKVLPSDKRLVFTAAELRKKQRAWKASIKLKGILSDAILEAMRR